MSRKHGVEYIGNEDEPAFIKRFKKKAGMKSSKDEIMSKHASLLREGDDDDYDRYDETPQIVVPDNDKHGLKVTEDDVNKYVSEQKLKIEKLEEDLKIEKECFDAETGRLKFRKPSKSSANEKTSTFKTKKLKDKSKNQCTPDYDQPVISKSSNQSSKLTKKLLSFQEDNDVDDE